MIAIVDYGMGNLRSVENAIALAGEQVEITRRPETLRESRAIVLPGVGAFRDGMNSLKDSGILDILQEEVITNQKPLLGICLGMQLLARKSYEGGEYKGLGWIDGVVARIEPGESNLRVPHVGWNNILVSRDVLFDNFDKLPDGHVVYFSHSYAIVLDNDSDTRVIATCAYGSTLNAGVRKGNVVGLQFHPEKSQNVGLHILKQFVASIQ